MGDGRYYTLFQFANIFVLTCTIGTMLVMTTLLYMKQKEKRFFTWWVMFAICLYVYLMTLFLDEITFSLNFSLRLKEWGLIALCLMLGIWHQIIYKPKQKLLLFVWLMGLLSLIGSNIYHGQLIQIFAYNKEYYSVGMITIIWFWFLYLMGIHNLRCMGRGSAQLEQIDKRLVCIGMFLVSLGFIHDFMGLTWLPLQIYMSPMLLFLIYYSANKWMTQYFTPQILTDALDGITEQVILCDSRGRIVYENAAAKRTLDDWGEEIHPKTLKRQILKNGYDIVHEYNKGIEFKTYHQPLKYKRLTFEEVVTKGTYIGNLYTVSDFSDYNEVLVELQSQIKQLQTRQNELIHFSKIKSELIEDTEKKESLKKINRMIDHNSANVLENLKTIQENMNDSLTKQKMIDKVLKESRELLYDVRQIVHDIYRKNEVNRFD